MTNETGGYYSEIVPAPLWLHLVIIAGVIALVFDLAVLSTDCPSAPGWSSIVYFTIVVALVLLVFVAFTFHRLVISVDDETLRFRFGVISKRILLETITSIEAKRYTWLTYGGWGIRIATRGRRAYSLPGVAQGVEVTVGRERGERRYFVSSNRPEELAAAIQSALSARSRS